MMTIAVFALLLLFVFALILGRKSPLVLVAVLSLTAGILIGDTSFGAVVAHFVSAAFSLFG